jgi:selenocysteine lyase/cysteine desulfurase
MVSDEQLAAEYQERAETLRKRAVGLIDDKARADRSSRQYLRLSPHFYNTDTELHRVLEML